MVAIWQGGLKYVVAMRDLFLKKGKIYKKKLSKSDS